MTALLGPATIPPFSKMTKRTHHNCGVPCFLTGTFGSNASFVGPILWDKTAALRSSSKHVNVRVFFFHLKGESVPVRQTVFIRIICCYPTFAPPVYESIGPKVFERRHNVGGCFLSLRKSDEVVVAICISTG